MLGEILLIYSFYNLLNNKSRVLQVFFYIKNKNGNKNLYHFLFHCRN